MRAIITVGLGFGDEGKGATVEFLVRSLNAGLVVRYSGGAQAGHNIETSTGKRHTFSQFGAGTLAGTETYIGPNVILNPAAMIPEAEHLQSLGVSDPWSLLSVHPDCLISTQYHVWMNRLRELARGSQRHGSCGLGIGEARQYWLCYGHEAVVAADLAQPDNLLKKLRLLRQRSLLELQQLESIDRTLASELYEWLPSDEASLLLSVGSQLTLRSELPTCEVAIFEGAQGTLLDESFGFHPFTTWSTVTPLHAFEMLSTISNVDATVLGITRAYSTRHGAGPFPTYCKQMTDRLTDHGNPHNPWQGSIRFGQLDLVLLEYAARVSRVDALFVNHLDEVDENCQVASSYRDLDRIEVPATLAEQERNTHQLERAEPMLEKVGTAGLLERLGDIAPIVGTGHGPRMADRVWSKHEQLSLT